MYNIAIIVALYLLKFIRGYIEKHELNLNKHTLSLSPSLEQTATLHFSIFYVLLHQNILHYLLLCDPGYHTLQEIRFSYSTDSERSSTISSTKLESKHV